MAAIRQEVDPIAGAVEKEPELMPRLAWISERGVFSLLAITRDGRDPTEHEHAFVHEIAIRCAPDAFRWK